MVATSEGKISRANFAAYFIIISQLPRRFLMREL
jgi:hypothetical protein